MPIPGLVANTVIGDEVLYRDYGTMLMLTLLLIAFIYGFRRKGRVGRSAGTVLLLAYVSYLGLLLTQA